MCSELVMRTAKEDAAGGGLLQPRYQPQQRRLACAVEMRQSVTVCFPACMNSLHCSSFAAQRVVRWPAVVGGPCTSNRINEWCRY